MPSPSCNLVSRRSSRGRVQPRYPQRVKPTQVRPPRSTVNMSSNSNVSYLNNSVTELRSPVIDFAAARLIKNDHQRRGSPSFRRREVDKNERAGRKISNLSLLHKSFSSPQSFKSAVSPIPKNDSTSINHQKAANVATPNRVGGGHYVCPVSTRRPAWNSSTKGLTWNYGTRKSTPGPGRQRAPHDDGGSVPKEQSERSKMKNAFAKSSKSHSRSPRILTPQFPEPKTRNDPKRGPPPPCYPPPKPGFQGENAKKPVEDNAPLSLQIHRHIFDEIICRDKVEDNAPLSLQIHRHIFDEIICRDKIFGETLARVRDAYEEAFHEFFAKSSLAAMKGKEENQVLLDELGLLKMRTVKAQKEQNLVEKRVQETREAIQADHHALQETLDKMARNAGHTLASEKKRNANGNPSRVVRVRPPPGLDSPTKRSLTALEEFKTLEFQSLPRPTPRLVDRPRCVPPLFLHCLPSDSGSIMSTTKDTVRISELMGSYRPEEMLSWDSD